MNGYTRLITVIGPSVNCVGQMERLNTTVGVFEGQDKGSDSFIIAEFKPTEADFFVSAGCIRVEEIGLIDKELVFNSINEVRVDGFLKVL